MIDRSYNTLVDLDLSRCNLSFENSLDLIKILRICGQNLADSWYNGQIQGTIRYLNISYNPFNRS